MSRSRKVSIVSLVFMVVVALFASSGDQALTWSRIGQGGVSGAYNYLQQDVSAVCLFGGKLCFANWGGQVWSYDGKDWVLIYKPEPGQKYIYSVSALAVMGGYLYAGMCVNDETCQVWRTRGTGKAPYTWTRVSGPSNVEKKANYAVSAMAVRNGRLYVGAVNDKGCQVWVCNGRTWTQVVGQGAAGTPTGPGFGDKNNFEAESMAVSSAGDFYVGTGRWNGAEVWRLNDSGWALINKPGFGVPANSCVRTLAFFNHVLYAGTVNDTNGCQVWKFVGPGASDWTQVGGSGLGDVHNRIVTSMAAFGDPAGLFVITGNEDRGCQVLRMNGNAWEKASANGFGKGPANAYGDVLAVFGKKLYAGTGGSTGSRIYATAGGAKVPFVWKQVNDDGFTRNDNEWIGAAAFFGGKLHVGTYSGLGCEVWRYEGSAWTQIAAGGFGDPNNQTTQALAAANGYLYAGADNWPTGAEVWRYDGSKWAQANKDGFGDPSTRRADAMIVFKDKLYVGTWSYTTKAKVWRCDGLKTNQWTQVNTNGFGVSTTNGVQSFAVFKDKLYAGSYDNTKACLVWRYDGPGPSNWTAVSDAGFGVKANYAVSRLAVFKNALYATTWAAGGKGCEVWRYSGSGKAWTQVNVSGFGKKANEYADAMIAAGDVLYVGTWNSSNGGEIWAYDGSAWSKVNRSGFGTSANIGIESFAGDGIDLYAGTENDFNGAEVWTTGAGSSNPLIFREAPFPAVPNAFRGQPGKASRPEYPGRTRRPGSPRHIY
jgi:hypothetical protein